MKKIVLTLALTSIVPLCAMQLHVPGSSVPSLSSSTHVKDIESQEFSTPPLWRRMVNAAHFWPARTIETAALFTLAGFSTTAYCHSNDCSVSTLNAGTLLPLATTIAIVGVYNSRWVKEIIAAGKPNAVLQELQALRLEVEELKKTR